MIGIRSRVLSRPRPGGEPLGALAEWTVVGFTLLAALLALAGLSGCEEDRSRIHSGVYTPTRLCDGRSCAEDPVTDRVIDVTLRIDRGDQRATFDLPDGTRIDATFAFAPRVDWPADCYIAGEGKQEMEVARIDTPLDLGGLHFASPVLVRYCGVPDPVYVTLFDAAAAPYPWTCGSDRACVEFMEAQ